MRFMRLPLPLRISLLSRCSGLRSDATTSRRVHNATNRPARYQHRQIIRARVLTVAKNIAHSDLGASPQGQNHPRFAAIANTERCR